MESFLNEPCEGRQAKPVHFYLHVQLGVSQNRNSKTPGGRQRTFQESAAGQHANFSFFAATLNYVVWIFDYVIAFQIPIFAGGSNFREMVF